MGDAQRWQLAGTAPEISAERLVPAIFGPWAPLVVHAAGVERGQSGLDVACGTGAVALSAARRVGATGSVTGLDDNPGMLAVAAARSPGSGVRWCEGDAQALLFP
jgi:ubiquinone/menaquinone biosynthesis C-methylase UbiE